MMDIEKVKPLGDNVLIRVSESELSKETKTNSGIIMPSNDTRRSIIAEIVRSNSDELSVDDKVPIPRYLLDHHSRGIHIGSDSEYSYYIINKVDINAKIGD